MKARISLIFFSFFLVSPCFAKTTLLSSGDVRGVMNQLFEYHIDKNEMTSVVLERSLKIYIKHFDPAYSYLLQEEAFPYMHSTETLLRKMLADYQKDRFTTFFALNQKIQDSIYRAREWRREWEANPIKLISAAREVKPEMKKPEAFVRTYTELKERHYRRFLEFISFQMQELSRESYEGKEAKLVALCEKQLSTMENEYLGIGDKNVSHSDAQQEHFIILRTLKALSHSLDAHTSYYSPDEAYVMKVQLEKGMCGIGVVLREGIDGITIHDVIAGGPAAKSGQIEAGDTIVEVDGKQIEGLSFHTVLDIMKGKEGTKTTLGIQKNAASTPNLKYVELVRAKITLEDQRVDWEAEPYGDGVIGKITLHSFYEGGDGLSSEKDIKEAIGKLREQGPLYGLVLDMRENSGGFLSQAVRVSGLFISNGVVVISKYSDGSIKYYRAVGGSAFYEGPLVVLISRGSASATEIVAQTLKDYGVAVIVGDEQSYGKGTIQHQTVTSDRKQSFFKVTIGRYYTVSGSSTQIDGVKADILIPSKFNFEEIGEGYLEYPLPADSIASAYDDTLSDIEPFARKWFQKYYLPTLQNKETKWEAMIPLLRENSYARLEQNRNYQLFLKEIKDQVKPITTTAFGINDMQMDEAVNVVKDMIFLSDKEPAHSALW